MHETKSVNPPEAPEYVYVCEAAVLERLIERIGVAQKIALDTEADSLHNYFEKVCLIQLTIGSEHYLVDPLANLELRGFLEALADKALILHGADYDLRTLRASTGFRPRGEVFDTMIAAQLLGIEQIGLAALIARCFAVAIGKAGQKSDWSRRPLSEPQLRYAVNDTRYLEALADQLAGELRERGRMDWHRESCRAMVEATGRDRARDPESAWRIKGSGRLARRQLAYLRELWSWRDDQARAADLPAFKVFGNEQMFELLHWAEAHPGASLDQAPKLPRNIRGTRLQLLNEAIARVSGMDPIQWPERKIHEPREDLPADCHEQLDALRAECASIAAELGIAASTLAPRAALEIIARGQAQSVDEIISSAGLLRWQADLVQRAMDSLQIKNKNWKGKIQRARLTR